MERIEFISKNDMPFCSLSKEFPEIKFFRWCNSAVDYLEFYGNMDDIQDLEKALPTVARSIGSKVVYRSVYGGSLTVMFSCRCTLENSTISMAEESGCIWEAPLVYIEGMEHINVLSIGNSYSEKLFSMLESIGEVKIAKKTVVTSGNFRDSFFIRLSDLFGKMTESQIRSLQLAIRAGYFSIPRREDLDGISKTLGISKSTAEEHLNRARNKLMSSIEPYLDLYISTIGNAREGEI
ncbi:MAG: helix-turn-helix domain-containing protein [Thermoplasmatales archaeon]